MGGGKGALERLLCGAYVAYHYVVAGIYHVGHPVHNPEGRAPREGDVVGAIYAAIALRNDVGAAVHGGEDGHVGIVATKPKDTANGVRKVFAHLGHDDPSCLLRRDGAFVEVFLAIHSERQGRQAIGRVVDASAKVLRKVERSAFVVVAHGLLNLLHRDAFLGLYVERHGLVCAAKDIGKELFATVGKHVVEAPYAGFAIATSTKVEGRVGIGKAEVFVQAAEVALFARKGDDVGRVEAVLFIVQRELMDAGLVGMGRDAIVGDANSHPHSALHAYTLAYHLHNPYLARVGYGKRLATAVVAIFLHQVGHHLDGFAGRLAALQGDVDKAAIVDDAGGIYQLFAAAKGGFGDGELMLVHVANNVVGGACLGDFAQVLTSVPLVDRAHSALGVGTGGIVVELAKESVRVC